MTSSNGNIFRVTGPLCGEFTGHRWIPHTKASDVDLWRFLWSGDSMGFKLFKHLWNSCIPNVCDTIRMMHFPEFTRLSFCDSSSIKPDTMHDVLIQFYWFINNQQGNDQVCGQLTSCWLLYINSIHKWVCYWQIVHTEIVYSTLCTQLRIEYTKMCFPLVRGPCWSFFHKR